MVRIGASPAPPATAATAVLPKVVFTKVEDDAFTRAGSVSDSVARSYGCTHHEHAVWTLVLSGCVQTTTEVRSSSRNITYDT
jgi:hypothetical protein